MKKINIITIALLVFAAGFSFADDSQIELPDLTTIVTSEQTDIEEIAAPDFADVVKVPEDSGTLVPELPEVEVQGDSKVVIADSNNSEKQVYAQGQAGGGFPSTFVGSFSVSRITGNEPFKIAFSHFSEAGFSGNSLCSGYNMRNTDILLDKTFTWNKLKFTCGGTYEDWGNGLQNQESGIYAENQNDLSGNFLIDYQLPKGFTIGSSLGLGYYTRYADMEKGISCDSWISHSSIIDINPVFYGTWANDFFKVQMDGSFWFDGEMKKSYLEGNRYAYRTLFDVKGSWTYEKIQLYGGAGIVYGDNINSNKIIAPFNLGFSTSFPVYYSDRNTSIQIEGGLKSYKNDVNTLEKTYKFTSLNVLPSETSAWYGKADVTFPLKTEFTGELGVDISKTAFNNGQWVPDFTDASYNSGLYGFTQKELFLISTDAALTYRHKIFAGTVKWHANWKDLPAMENHQNFYVDISLQDSKTKWGADLNTTFSLDASDKIPVLNFEGFVGISPAVKIVLSADDILKFFDPQPRIYAGKYISDSGNVRLLVKFLF